ncbi:MAG: TerB family tellurite resistance protein [Alphaproteobacteria bacterium]|nr:TerB family tellurite resistance protein [Alphaproteobacteria bacterium]
MFERLIESLGTISTRDDATQARNPETQLAAAILLYAVVPADHVYASAESAALHEGLRHIFRLPDDKCRKLVSRAMAQYSREPTLLAPATLLKHRLSLSFRQLILATARRIALADGELHNNELDVLARISSLLGLNIAESSQNRSA